MNSPGADGTGRASGALTLRAFAVLEHMAAAGSPQSLDDVTTATRLAKPTAFRILHLLREAGLLRRDAATKRYTVGPRLAALSLTLWQGSALRSQWRDALHEAADATGEGCSVVLLEGRQVLVVDHAPARHPLRLHLDIGTRMPLHCTASGKLLLSGMSDDDAHQLLGPEPYVALTPRTVTRFAGLAPALAFARRAAVGVDDGEALADTVAVAVPVATPGGRMVAALGLRAPASRVSMERCLEFVPVLRAAAARVAATMSPLGGAEAAAARSSTSPRPPGLGTGAGVGTGTGAG